MRPDRRAQRAHRYAREHHELFRHVEMRAATYRSVDEVANFIRETAFALCKGKMILLGTCVLANGIARCKTPLLSQLNNQH